MMKPIKKCLEKSFGMPYSAPEASPVSFSQETGKMLCSSTENTSQGYTAIILDWDE